MTKWPRNMSGKPVQWSERPKETHSSQHMRPFPPVVDWLSPFSNYPTKICHIHFEGIWHWLIMFWDMSSSVFLHAFLQPIPAGSLLFQTAIAMPLLTAAWPNGLRRWPSSVKQKSLGTSQDSRDRTWSWRIWRLSKMIWGKDSCLEKMFGVLFKTSKTYVGLCWPRTTWLHRSTVLYCRSIAQKEASCAWLLQVHRHWLIRTWMSKGLLTWVEKSQRRHHISCS